MLARISHIYFIFIACKKTPSTIFFPNWISSVHITNWATIYNNPVCCEAASQSKSNRRNFFFRKLKFFLSHINIHNPEITFSLSPP